MTDPATWPPSDLRDRFAAAALQGLLAAKTFTGDSWFVLIALYAQYSYKLADALLAERERPTTRFG